MPWDSQDTRRRLLEAAIMEFSAYGIAGARVDRLALAAKANKQAIYAYFGSKAALFAAAFEDRIRDFHALVSVSSDFYASQFWLGHPVTAGILASLGVVLVSVTVIEVVLTD